MEALDPNLSPNKRLKTETQTLTLESQISPSSTKGKAPISDDLSDNDGDESPANLPPQNCGICFSEQGKTVRGFIDSCDHYFCFLCIIEWSKIESRCPLCRARFSNIRRMRKDGSFVGEGFVRVPVRDQLYDPFGDPTDPYGQAKCTVCNGTNDESLLLLCDLCDSPWHTYCVGLGATVPEGDWYCRDCTILRAEQCDDEEEDDSVKTPYTSKHVDEASSTPGSVSVSIFDIVREPSESQSGVDRLLKLVSVPKKKFSGTSIASDRAKAACAGSLRGTRDVLESPSDVKESSARTLHNCRNVQRHISVLRENWDAFRSGSLSFSSNLLDSSKKGCRKVNGVAACAGRSCKSQSFSSTSSLQSKVKDTSCSAKPNKQPYNVDRAWKLMNIAKSVKQVGKEESSPKSEGNKAQGRKADNISSKCVPLVKKDLLSPGSGTLNRFNVSSGRLAQRSAQQQLTSILTEAASTSSGKCPALSMSTLSKPRKLQFPAQAHVNHDKVSLQSLGKLGRGLPTVSNDGIACSMYSCRPIAGAFNVDESEFRMKERSTCPGDQMRNANICVTSQAEVQASAHVDNCYARADFSASQQHLGGRSSNVFDERTKSACSTSPRGPLVGTSNASCVKLQREECPSKIAANIASKSSKDDEAKGEIQSLVKLNLKLLCKEKRLGADAFKEIARLSTHAILAACGFEHRKIVRSYPRIVCDHGDQIQQLRRSTLMPSSCTDCFYLFVKDVVNSIMSDKLNSAGVAC